MSHSPDPSPQGEWGPVVTGRGHRRWGRITLIVVLGLLLAVAGTGIGAALYASSQITRIEVGGLAEGGEGPMHVLVVGSDSRAGLTPEQQAELTTGDEAGSRTDTIFVLSIDRGRAAILAFPRDLLVTRCDGSRGRINAASGIGGPTCMVETVSQLSGLPIEHYVSIDFLGFVGIVDAVGGVEVCIERDIVDPFSGADFRPGCQTIDGRQALSYVRVRKIDDDFGRIQRQQQFLRALAGEIASPSTVLDPFALFRTAGRVGAALTADEGLGVLGLLRLGWGARGIARGALVTHTVPGTPQTVGGAAVVVPDEAAAEALFAQFRDGSILQTATTGLRREDVEVEVRNGAAVEGLAGTTRDALEARGYTVTGIGNADVQDTTTIRYPAGQQEAAQLLASDLPVEPELVEDAGLSRLVLVLGRDVAGS